MYYNGNAESSSHEDYTEEFSCFALIWVRLGSADSTSPVEAGEQPLLRGKLAIQ